MYAVAPLAGAWIETNPTRTLESKGKVAPLAGAWIETTAQIAPPPLGPSHPLRVRGLKRQLKLHRRR